MKYIKIHSVLILLFISIATSTVGQKLYDFHIPPKGLYPGFVVKTNNDTVYGNIEVKAKNRKIFYEVGLITKDNQKEVFHAEDLIAFQFDKFQFVGNINLNGFDTTRIIFLQQLNDGYFSFYRYLELEFKYVPTGVVPVVVSNTEETYYFTYGKLPLNRVYSLRELSIYATDNSELDSMLYYGKLRVTEIPYVINNYNKWLISSGQIVEKNRRDSLFSIINLHEADSCNLLYVQDKDSIVFDYFYRLVNYYANTITDRSHLDFDRSDDIIYYDVESYYPDIYDIKKFVIYDHRDKHSNKTTSGLKIFVNNGYRKIGEWKYCFDGRSKGDVKLKKHEYYNSNGKLHGFVTEYKRSGDVIKSISYENGKKIKPTKK